MRHPSKSSLVWIAVNCLFGSKPLFIPKLVSVHSIQESQIYRKSAIFEPYLNQCSGERIENALCKISDLLSRSKLAYEIDKSLRNLHLIY